MPGVGTEQAAALINAFIIMILEATLKMLRSVSGTL